MLDYIVHLGLTLDILIMIAYASPLRSSVWAVVFIFTSLEATVHFCDCFDSPW